jgi:hypothetical protein
MVAAVYQHVLGQKLKICFKSGGICSGQARLTHQSLEFK